MGSFETPDDFEAIFGDLTGGMNLEEGGKFGEVTDFLEVTSKPGDALQYETLEEIGVLGVITLDHKTVVSQDQLVNRDGELVPRGGLILIAEQAIRMGLKNGVDDHFPVHTEEWPVSRFNTAWTYWSCTFRREYKEGASMVEALESDNFAVHSEARSDLLRLTERLMACKIARL